MNPTKYALAEMQAERFPQIWISSLVGDFYLTDRDGVLLAGRTYKTRNEAERARSRFLDTASKKFWRAAA